MPKLSQIVPKKVRTEIPFYYYENGELKQDSIKVYSPEVSKVVDIQKEISGKSNEEVFLILVREFTDLEIDMQIDEFKEFASYFGDTYNALQSEVMSIINEISLFSYEQVEKLFDMPDEKRDKLLAVSPELRESFIAYTELLNRTKDTKKIEPDQEEIEKQKKLEEINERMKELEKLKNELSGE